MGRRCSGLASATRILLYGGLAALICSPCNAKSAMQPTVSVTASSTVSEEALSTGDIDDLFGDLPKRSQTSKTQAILERGPITTLTTSTTTTSVDAANSKTEVVVVQGVPIIDPPRFRLRAQVLGGRSDMNNLYVHGPVMENLTVPDFASPRMEKTPDQATEFSVDTIYGAVAVLCHKKTDFANPNSSYIIVDQTITTSINLVILHGNSSSIDGLQGVINYANKTGTPRVGLAGPNRDELMYMNDDFGGWLACYVKGLDDPKYNPHGDLKAVLQWWDLGHTHTFNNTQCARVALMAEWVDPTTNLCR